MAHPPFTGRTQDTPYIQTSNNYTWKQWDKLIRDEGVETFTSRDVFTIDPWRSAPPESYAWLVHQGRFQAGNLDMEHVLGEYYLRQLNLDDLKEPVPADKYYDARRDDCWGNQTHCATITAGSNRPKLIIANRAWEKLNLPDMAFCWNPGLVDPPITLKPLGRDAVKPDEILPEVQVIPTPSIVQGGRASAPPRAGPAVFTHTPEATPYVLGPIGISNVPKSPSSPGSYGLGLTQLLSGYRGQPAGIVDYLIPGWRSMAMGMGLRGNPKRIYNDQGGSIVTKYDLGYPEDNAGYSSNQNQRHGQEQGWRYHSKNGASHWEITGLDNPDKFDRGADQRRGGEGRGGSSGDGSDGDSGGSSGKGTNSRHRPSEADPSSDEQQNNEGQYHWGGDGDSTDTSNYRIGDSNSLKKKGGAKALMPNVLLAFLAGPLSVLFSLILV
jgi:hypothetical protein